jgi:chromosome segregation ATPase
MPDHDPQATGYVWLAQWAGGLFATITTALGSYFLFRRGKVRADASDRKTEATREQHALDVAVAQTKSTYDDLREYSERLEKRIDKLESERDASEVEIDRLRGAQFEALRRIFRLENQVRELGGEPTNGHG